jgi:hypothetical protein
VGTLQSTKYAQTTNVPDEQFRRLTGVSRKVFGLMIEVLIAADAQKKARGARKKRRKKHSLTKEEKHENRRITSERVVIRPLSKPLFESIDSSNQIQA